MHSTAQDANLINMQGNPTSTLTNTLGRLDRSQRGAL